MNDERRADELTASVASSPRRASGVLWAGHGLGRGALCRQPAGI